MHTSNANIGTIVVHTIIQLICKAQLYDMSNWAIPTTRFPHKDQNSLVVFDDITRDIWVIGGYWHGDTIYKYNIDHQELTDITSIINPNGTLNFGYNYVNNVNAVIINRTIYFANSNYGHIESLNIDTFEYNNDIGIDYNDVCMCMVTGSDQTKLYLSAGYFSKNLVIWDLLTSTEITGAPLTNHGHRGGGCHVIDNILYVMSGEDSKIIEYIDLNVVNNNLNDAKWNIITDTFPTIMYSPSLASCDHLILIMGGNAHPDAHDLTQNVFVFDTQTHSVSKANPLPFNIAFAAGICVESRIYIFRGYREGYGIEDTFMYSDLLLITNGPTPQPTTIEPTMYPSSYPIIKPSIHPTYSPIVDPTVAPTKDPTIDPTIGPTLDPTKDPTFDPTANTKVSAGSVNSDITFQIPQIALNVGSVVLVVLCVILCCYVFYNKRKNRKSREEIQAQNTSIDRLELGNTKQKTISITPPGFGDMSVTIQRSMTVDIQDEADHMDSSDGVEGIESSVSDHDSDDNDFLNEALDEVLRVSSTISSLPKHIQELKDWLIAHHLDQYLGNFVLNGYQSLDFVKDINDVHELIEIDIKNKDDQNKLMSLIRLRLNNTVIGGESVIQMHVLVTSGRADNNVH